MKKIFKSKRGAAMNKITAWFMSIIMVVLGAMVAFVPFGNPISKYLVTENAETYIEENFEGSDYFIESVAYDFKTGSYYVQIGSPTSKDSSFTLYAGTNGKITFDTYESAVKEKWNTANRINDEYWDKTKAIFESESFPYNQHIAFGEILFKESGTSQGETIPEGAVSTKDLVLDKVYDVNEFAEKSGRLTVYIYDNDLSVECLAEILLGIKEIFDENNLSFYAIDCVLEYPRPENDNEPFKEGRTEVMGFLSEDIYEQGLAERVRIADETAKEYWAQQDAMKDK